MAKVVWVGFSVGLLALGGCLASASTQGVTPAKRLQLAKASAARGEWADARESAVAFWVTGCKESVDNADDCASAQLVRGEAELVRDAPESALMAFRWAIHNGSAGAKEKAIEGAERATAALQKLLVARATGMSWLVIEQDFDDDHLAEPERAAFTLDGQPLAEVGPQRFALREHRVLAQAIAPGTHQLAVQIHWRGRGANRDFVWKTFRQVEIEASEGGAIVASLAVRYNGDANTNSAVQRFELTSLP